MTRLSLLKEKITFLKEWILGSSPRMIGRGVMMTMTRSRIFTFLMVALLGGFVLSTSSYAAENYYQHVSKANITADTEIAGFIKNKLVEGDSAAQGKIAATKKTIKDEYDRLFKEADKERINFNQTSGTFVNKYDCDKSTLKTSTAHELLGKGYSWVNHVQTIVGTCKKTPSSADVDNLTKIATSLEQKIGAYLYLQNQKEYDGTVFEYLYCRKPNDKSTCSSMYFVVNEDFTSVTSLSGASQGCMPLPFKLHEAQSCLFCPLFEIIYTTIQVASTSAFATLGKSLATLVAIGLALWIALMVLQNVSSMTKQDALEFLTNLFKNSFKVIIAYALLSHASIVYDWIIGPLLRAGFEFGASFLSHVGDKATSIGSCSLEKKAATGVLPAYIYSYLLCFIKAVQFELSVSQAIGDSLMCISWHQGMGNISVLARVMPDFNMMLQGALIFAISFILSVAFAFYLIDATVQLGIFGILLPFLILCWPFKITNGYFKQGVNIFMNSWFVFVFMGIIVNIVLQLIGQSLTGGKGNLATVEAAINGNDIKTLKDLLSIGFSGFLVLLACCVFSIKLMQKVEEVAGKFSGGLGLGIGNKIGGLAAQGATAGAKLAGKAVKGTASGIVNAKLWEETDKDGNPTGRFLSAADGAKALKNKVTGAVGRGFTKGTKAFGRGLAKPFIGIRNLINKRNDADGHLPPSE